MSSCLHLSVYLTKYGETTHRLNIHVELSIRYFALDLESFKK